MVRKSHDCDRQGHVFFITFGGDEVCQVCGKKQPALEGDRDGDTYDHDQDYVRLNKQHRRVLACMMDQDWWTLSDLENATGDPQASISARIRDFRKKRFGSHEVERRRKGGTFQYRLLLKERVNEV